MKDDTSALAMYHTIPIHTYINTILFSCQPSSVHLPKCTSGRWRGSHEASDIRAVSQPARSHIGGGERDCGDCSVASITAPHVPGEMSHVGSREHHLALKPHPELALPARPETGCLHCGRYMAIIH